MSDWTKNLKEQIIHFATWTRSNPDVYVAYSFNFELTTRSRQEKHHLADEVLDSTVVQVIQSIYDISKDVALTSCNGDDSLKICFLVNMSLKQITNNVLRIFGHKLAKLA